MRKKIILITTIIIGTIVLFSMPGYAIQIGLEPKSQTTFLGQSIDVDILIYGLGDNAAPSLAAFSMNIIFNPNILSIDSINSVVFGPYLGNPDDVSQALTSVFLPGFMNTPSDIVDIAESSLLEFEMRPSNFSSLPPYLIYQPKDFLLATLTFETIAPGNSPLSLSEIYLSDENGIQLTLAPEPDSASITVNPVPEPDTLLLFGTGLVGLAGFGRKKFRNR